MLPGPDQVVACPHCGHLALCRTWLSGNSFGARYWTDGKVEAPMLPREPEITRCRGCGKFFWVSEARFVEEMDPWSGRGARPEWKSVNYIQKLTESEYYEAIEAGMASDREREFHLRVLAWWATNDRFRYRADPGNQVNGAEETEPDSMVVANLRRLYDLLDPSAPDARLYPHPLSWWAWEDDLDDLLDPSAPEARLMKAEVARELGDFELARKWLDYQFPANLREVAELIRRLVEKRERRVWEIGVEVPA